MSLMLDGGLGVVSLGRDPEICLGVDEGASPGP